MTERVSEPITPTEIVTKTVNNNGQIYLGRDLAGKDLKVAYEVLETDEYECDDCGNTFDLAEVAIFNRGNDDERIVCTDCLSPTDRIIE